jgi:hypothetical protein
MAKGIADTDRTEQRIGAMLLDIYRPRFELQFAYHPHGKEIVDMLCMGGNPPELIHLWFAEAESYAAEAMRRPIRGATRQGIMRFKVVEGKS